MSPAASLSVAGLSKAFGDSPVLAGLDLEVPTGSLTAVLGPSGCGKTTLLRLLGGFEHADGGSIRLGERVLCDAAHPPRPRAPRDRLRPPGGRALPPPRRRRQRRLRPAARAAPRRPGRGAAASWSASQGLAKRLPHQLSGGQQQRVALARALAPGAGPGPARRALRRPRRRPARAGARRGPRRPCARPARPRCSSPTTRRRRSRWPTPSPSCAAGGSSRPPTRRRSTATRSTPRSPASSARRCCSRADSTATAPRPPSAACRSAAPMRRRRPGDA